MHLWIAALLHVGLPAGLVTLFALWRIAKPPLWLAALLTSVPALFWTSLAALVGGLLPLEAMEPFLWFATE